MKIAKNQRKILTFLLKSTKIVNFGVKIKGLLPKLLKTIFHFFAAKKCFKKLLKKREILRGPEKKEKLLATNSKGCPITGHKFSSKWYLPFFGSFCAVFLHLFFRFLLQNADRKKGSTIFWLIRNLDISKSLFSSKFKIFVFRVFFRFHEFGKIMIKN